MSRINGHMTDVAVVLVIGALIILFAGEPDLMDAIIYFLTKGALDG